MYSKNKTDKKERAVCQTRRLKVTVPCEANRWQYLIFSYMFACKLRNVSSHKPYFGSSSAQGEVAMT